MVAKRILFTTPPDTSHPCPKCVHYPEACGARWPDVCRECAWNGSTSGDKDNWIEADASTD